MLWTYYRAAKQRDGAAIAPTGPVRAPEKRIPDLRKRAAPAKARHGADAKMERGAPDGGRAGWSAAGAARRRGGAPTRGVSAWLRGRRQRPDRHRPRLAAATASLRVRVPACAGAVRPGTHGPTVVLFDLS